MDSYGGGGYFVDQKAAQVENIFLEFLKRLSSLHNHLIQLPFFLIQNFHFKEPYTTVYNFPNFITFLLAVSGWMSTLGSRTTNRRSKL